MGRKKPALQAAALALCLLSCRAVSARASEAVVNKGVSVQGVDVSGMTRAQALEAINTKVEELSKTPVTVMVGEDASSCTLEDLGLIWTNEEILDDMLSLGTSGSIVQRYKDRKDLEHNHKEYRLAFALEEETAAAYAKHFSSFNTEPVDAVIYTTDELTPGVEGGTEGRTVDTKGSAALLESLVSSWDGESVLSASLPYETVAPEVPYEELAVICDNLGTAVTDYSFSSYARAANVENGCRKISGTLLYPGEYFSVTAAVTPFSAENGYEQAPSYEENRVVDSYGGGICQVSTTLYNAVLKAEMEVTARSNHTMAVSYVPLSKDAAIAEGSMDMCFVNSLEYPVYIIGSAYGGTLTFTIYGHETRPAGRTLEFESRTISTIEPSGAMYYANPSAYVGYINQTQSSHTGYQAELWKNIYMDGEWVDSVQINSSYYNAVGTIYDVGVASPYPAVTQAMYSAIGSQSMASIQAVIASASQIGRQTEAPAAPAVKDTQAAPAVNEYGDVDEVY